MSATIKGIKEFFDNMAYSPYIEFINNDWVLLEEDREFKWADEYGDVYSAEMNDSHHSTHGHTFINGDNGFGENITYVFIDSNRLQPEEFEEYE